MQPFCMPYLLLKLCFYACQWCLFLCWSGAYACWSGAYAGVTGVTGSGAYACWSCKYACWSGVFFSQPFVYTCWSCVLVPYVPAQHWFLRSSQAPVTVFQPNSRDLGFCSLGLSYYMLQILYGVCPVIPAAPKIYQPNGGLNATLLTSVGLLRA